MKFYKRKKVIITGGAGGLGRELVKMLHNFGSDVTSIVSNTSDTTDLQGDIFRCDFNNISAVTELTKNDIFNNVDILINCAGIFPIKTLEETSIEEFDKILNIGKQHGYYGEGSGISNNPAVKNSEIYKLHLY